MAGGKVQETSGERDNRIPVTNEAGSARAAPILQSCRRIGEPGEDQLRTHLALVDQMQDALIIRDLEDRICFWSKGAERLYGWRADEVIGQNIYEFLFAAQVEVLEHSTSRLAFTGEWAGELEQVTKSGQRVIVESHWRLHRDEFERPISVLIVNKDITEKKMLEGEILRAQRIEAVSKLAIGIAHDLNNVLATMLISISRLQRGHIELKDVPDLESWQLSAERAAALITRLLSLAKGHNEPPISIDVGRLVQETASVIKATFPQSIQIDTAIPEDLHSVSGNATHLYQVLINLCVNARDAMPCGGVLTIAAANVTLDKTAVLKAHQAKPGGYVLISVADTGTGIPAEITAEIFKPFFTTKDSDKGNGLGLFTVARIVKDHNGFIELMTTTGRGTQFMVYLPSQKDVLERDVARSSLHPALR
jgi:PAS domain S-box-containing protein